MAAAPGDEAAAALAKKLSASEQALAAAKLRHDELQATNTKLESDVAFERGRYQEAARKLTADKDAALKDLTARFNTVSEKRKEAFMKLHGYVSRMCRV